MKIWIAWHVGKTNVTEGACVGNLKHPTNSPLFVALTKPSGPPPPCSSMSPSSGPPNEWRECEIGPAYHPQAERNDIAASKLERIRAILNAVGED